MDTQVSGFRAAAITSKLVDQRKINAVMSELLQEKGGSGEIIDKEIAAKLVLKKWLSPYQADQLLAGRTKLTLGPYIITDWIGQGGMGQVFKAVHNMLGRDCAIKVLPISKSTPEAIANFRREIRTQAILDHPNLVRAYDAGEDGSVHFLVVEYVPGTDLRRLVRTKGKLSVQQASSIIKQAAEGLAHAHKNGLIHRDVKPGNILVTPEGIAKVSDLGLAGFVNDFEDPRAGKTVGTADYLSPEQIRSPLEVNAPSDVYSLGCTLYYAVTGKVPFPGGTPKSKARRHLEETPWHPRRFNDEVSDEFVDLIGDMMEKDPAMRIQSMLEVAERLAPWACDESPLLDDELARSRWTTPPPVSDQDTDPADELAEMALTEIGNSEASLSQSSQSGFQPKPPPPPTSNILKFSSVSRLVSNDVTFSLSQLLIVAGSSLLAGTVLGFLICLISRVGSG
ncbi:MAG TPA: serine/threonine-protein kinase [Pirellulaceae bacterium]|nr:serine/threonine-protein kinase [Pirellulaceae bacterium]HMO92888.1 serine/threonine-protein kinase [Pirellulaceae bacterium]HMP69166.1 serine/threonine-protein kinase [Pirellulaceae bacterium]